MNTQTVVLVLAILVASPIQVKAEESNERIRQLFPATVAALEEECRMPSTLDTKTYTSEKVSFTCWDAPNEVGERTGRWLGILPLTESGTPFVQPLVCATGDQVCNRWLPRLQTRYPTALQQAEFQCAVKNGTLLTTFSTESVTIHCGFYTTALFDENGDGVPEYEDPVSVDLLMTTLPLLRF